jgi:ribosomal protein S18 acetylase RimI-like enzyme
MLTAQKIEIRELKPDEWEIYRDIRLKALKDEPDAFISTYDETSKRAESEWRQKLISQERSFTLFAFRNGKAIGMMGTYQDSSDNQGVLDLFGVYVLREHRGTGVAQELMKNIISRARKIPGVTKIRLECEYSQIAARRFYEKVGFKKYDDNPDRKRVLMELAL